MSSLLGANLGFGGSGMLVPNDEQSHYPTINYTWDGRANSVQIEPWRPGVRWTGSGFSGAAGAGTFGMSCDDLSGVHSVWSARRVSGGQQAPKLIGTTRDSGGAVLGSVLVQGFVTGTNVYIGQVTSDAAGYYELPSYAGSVAHYLVCYKAGSPDVAGVSVNTLIPV